MTDITYAYVGFKACGCCTAAAVDSPPFAKDNAKFVARLIRDGMRVERLPLEDARKVFKTCDCGEE
jgi:hypothetical protein